ncbi:DMT family transporter [Deinococcus peraridilitoris]|uniref:EamA-like transporter family n=1 Tax=Deinococcus peraridilitoris (strain DSM 19664 / LMG 22246 / CIP 109416 / KR-200) TaxID=937777 RepID=L0A164_DEIPD|nr:DMT family transporter [Deinococcus peraridilitoris]AFZ67613.1 EamA-like transporter family [Deinococcus peraridilitoris DSM 19664]
MTAFGASLGWKREQWIGLACALVTVLIWSGFILVSRLGAKGSLSPFDISALRFGVSGLVMLPFLLRSGTGGLRLWQVAALGVTAGLGYALLAYSGFHFAPAAHAAVFMPGMLPFFTAALAWGVLGERWTRARFLGLAVVGVGIALLAADELVRTGGATWRGDLLFLGASLLWAAYGLLARQWRVGPLQATAVIGVFCLVTYWPPYLLSGQSGLLAAPLSEVLLQGIYQGFLAVVVALITYTRALQTLGPALTTTITSLTPALAALSAVPLLGESLSAVSVAGVMVVTLGVLVSVVRLSR